MAEKQAKKPSVKIGLYVHVVSDNGYRHWRAYPVTVGPNRWDLEALDRGDETRAPVASDKIRNIADTETYNGLYLHNFTVNSQGNDGDSPRRLYGWDVDYRDVYAVDLMKAQRMAKTLGTVDKRITALRERFGYATSWGGFLARVAEAIGATCIVREVGKSRMSSYDDIRHRVQTVGDGVYGIDREIAEWSEPKVETASA